MKHSEINSAKQNKPVKGITLQYIRRQNAIANRFEVGLDLFIKYIICLQNRNVSENNEPSWMNFREQDPLNEQFPYAAKLHANRRRVFSLLIFFFFFSFLAVSPPWFHQSPCRPRFISEVSRVLSTQDCWALPGSSLLQCWCTTKNQDYFPQS